MCSSGVCPLKAERVGPCCRWHGAQGLSTRPDGGDDNGCVFSRSIVQEATRRALANGALQPIETQTILLDSDGVQGLLAQRYDGRPGTVYLVRPDQHVAARWREFDEDQIQAALRRCLGR